MSSPLPPLYARWMRDALPAPVTGEPRATCHACAMCPPEPEEEEPFHPETKCCTYLPILANYLVGAILDDEDPALAEGRASVLARIERGVSVTPVGLGWTWAFESIYQSDQRGIFGRTPEIRCPHYLHEQGGLCGVWRHRNAICSTWFCRYERGARGRTWWRAVKDLLCTIESTLAWWVIDALDVGADTRERLVERPGLIRGYGLVDGHPGTGDVTEASRRAVWGRWYGAELRFYREAAAMVRDLDWSAVVALHPRGFAAELGAIQAAAEARDAALPPWLEPGTVEILGTDGDDRLVRAYAAYDWVRVHRGVLESLEVFRRLPVKLALEEIERRGHPIDLGKIANLVDFGILRIPESR